MHSASLLAPLVLAARSLAQAVPEGIAPSSDAPSGCQTTSDGTFTIGTLKISQVSQRKMARETALDAANGSLVCSLKDGVLRDSNDRTGSIVSNHQFQFDGPPQAGALFTGGFSICKNGSLAIGGTTRWWQCASGAFHNLYDESIGDQCEEIRIQTQPTNPSSASASASPSASPSPSANPSASQNAYGASSPSAISDNTASSAATPTDSASNTAGSASTASPTASSHYGNASATLSASGSSSHNSSALASPTRASGSRSAATASASSSAAPAPPASGGAATSWSVSLGAMFVAGAVLLL